MQFCAANVYPKQRPLKRHISASRCVVEVSAGFFFSSEKGPAGNCPALRKVGAVVPYMALSCDTDQVWNDSYRWGFNGVTRDDGISGRGNSLEFKLRGYDSRLARFKSRDPLADRFPWWSTYQFGGNSPIGAIDLEGGESLVRIYGPTSVEPVLTLDWSKNPGKLGTGELNLTFGKNKGQMFVQYVELGRNHQIKREYNGELSFNKSEGSDSRTGADQALEKVFKPLIKAGEFAQKKGDEHLRMSNKDWNGGGSWEGDANWEKKGWPAAKATVAVLGTVFSGGAYAAFLGASSFAGTTATLLTLYDGAVVGLNVYGAADAVKQAGGGSALPNSKNVNTGIDATNAVDVVRSGNPISAIGLTITAIDRAMQAKKSPPQQNAKKSSKP